MPLARRITANVAKLIAVNVSLTKPRFRAGYWGGYGHGWR